MRANRRTATQRILRLAGFLGSTLAVLVMVASLAFVVPGLVGYERYVITGGSMSGTFEKGAVVIEEVVPVADLQVGDVITYLPPATTGIGNLVTHRLVTVTRHEDGGLVYRTKGDANADVDPWTFRPGGAAQPRVVLSVPLVGYLFLAMNDRTTRMVVVGVPAGLVALLSLRELVLVLRPRPAPAAHRGLA